LTDTEASISALPDGDRGLTIVAQLTGGRCGARQTTLLSTGQKGTSVWFALPASPAASDQLRRHDGRPLP
jgi:hypothetical protein